MADPFSRLTARLRPRIARIGRRLGDQIAPAVRLARIDLQLSRTWSRHEGALRQELSAGTASAYTDLVMTVAERDPPLAQVVAHALPARLAAVSDDDRRRLLRLLRVVARDRPETLPLVIRTLPALLSRLDDESVARYLARGLELHAGSARKAESFLRMESGEGQRVADRLERGLRLSAVQRTLSLYARAHCGRDVQVRAGDGAFTDGRHIHLPALLDRFGDDRDFLTYRVLTARAAGYLEFGTLDLDLSLISGDWPDREPGELEVERLLRSFPNTSLARDLFGLLEELRIEARVRAEYPGVARDMDRLDESFRAPLRELDGLAPAEQAVEALVRRARGLEPPALPNPAAAAAAERAAPHLDRVRGVSATIGDTVAALQAAYAPLDALLRRVDPDSLTRLDQPDDDGDGAGAPGDAGGSDEGRGDGEGGRPPGSDGAERQAGPEDDPRDDYAARPVSPLEAGLRTDALSPADRDVESQALDLLDALREADPGEGASLAELRRKLHDEGRSYDEMAAFLDRNEAPSGPTAEGQPDPAGPVDGEREAVTGDRLDRDEASAGAQFLYPEWDRAIQDHKPDWVRVTEYVLEPGSRDFVQQVRDEHGALIHQLRRSFEALRPEAVRRIRGLTDGDDIDLDRAIANRIERRAGGSPDPRFYVRHQRQERDVAVAFLVDMSSSTNEVVGADSRRIIDIEKQALVLIAEAVDAIGDRSAIWGFSGYSRDQVAFYIAKSFSDPWSDRVQERVGRMTWKMENRDGAAIRHATALLAKERSRVKLLLLLSDGKPLDCGCDHYSDRYAQEDTRRALQEARQVGVHPFCITIDPAGQDYLGDLYGDTGYTVIDRVERLPQRLPLIYRRLTR